MILKFILKKIKAHHLAVMVIHVIFAVSQKGSR